ncbi:MAG: TolC family protein [Lentisphaeria bacterium]
MRRLKVYIFAVTTVVSFSGCVVIPPSVPEYNPAELSAPRPLIQELDKVATPPEVQGSLGVEDCVQLAFSNRRALSLADRLVATNLARAREIVAEDYPKLTGGVNWQGRSNDATVSGIGDRTYTSTSVELSVPIYDFGRTSNRVRAQRLLADAAGRDAERLRQEVRLAVSQTYFQVLRALKEKRVIEQSIAVLEEQLRIARDYLDQGLVAKNDVLAAEVQLAERRQSLIRARNDVRVALSRLNRLVGLPVTHETRLQDVLDVEPWHGSLTALFKTALEQRADLAAFQQRVDAAVRTYQSGGAEYAPDIEAFGRHDYNSDGSLVNQSWSTVGIGISLPFYQGGARDAKLARLQDEILNAVERRDMHKDDILLDVKDAYLRLANAREQVPVAGKRIELALENLEVTRDRYSQGLVTQTDVLAEENRLISARSDYFSALYGYHQAVVRLRNVIGGPLPNSSQMSDKKEKE